jgi:hypothetical protein
LSQGFSVISLSGPRILSLLDNSDMISRIAVT